MGRGSFFFVYFCVFFERGFWDADIRLQSSCFSVFLETPIAWWQKTAVDSASRFHPDQVVRSGLERRRSATMKAAIRRPR
jgi:hypothetical protein